MPFIPWGPSGEVVYNRTYSRIKPDGTRETWPETVQRVAEGNLALVHGDDTSKWDMAVKQESAELQYYMNQFAVIPAGRHLWATGVPGRQYLFNCWVAPWGSSASEHFVFTALRLFEGGGVGSNYSSRYLEQYGQPHHRVNVYITCRAGHQDEEELLPYLSDKAVGISAYVPDSREGWAGAIGYLVNQAFDPEGARDITFDVSGVRPSGSPLVSSGGTASGPAPFARMMLEIAGVLNSQMFSGMAAMEIDHAIAECVVAGGTRRSARMAIMAWDDPQVFRFINAKQDTGKHWTTNISVEVDNRFFEDAAQEGTVAHQVLQEVTSAMLENGEPGFWNRSLSQEGEVGEVLATNPCGEIVLEPAEPCNLGHVNLDWFYDKPEEELRSAHCLMTRFLIRATYGDVNDQVSRDVLDRNRRIGLGHFGVQGYWAKKGVKYSDIRLHAPKMLERLYDEVRAEARNYAFELRIPEPVKVTTVAPTGSIAKLPGVSEGIHPVYSKYFERRVRFSVRDDAQFQTVMDAQAKGFRVEDDIYDSSGMTKVVVYPTADILVQQVRDLGLDESVVQSADELTAREMLEVQRCYQTYWSDNAVSYTVNIAPGSLNVRDLSLLLAEFLPDLKGTTIMVDSTRPQAPYTRITREEYESSQMRTVSDGSDECKTGACPVK